MTDSVLQAQIKHLESLQCEFERQLLLRIPDVVITGERGSRLPNTTNATVHGVDGESLCKMIKENEKTKDIPCILLVSSFQSFDEQRAREAGVDDFFHKPFQSINEVVETVIKLIAKREEQLEID